MKIIDIKSYPVWVGERNQLLVKIETDDGVYGWGESGFSSREKSVMGIIDHYREWLIGRDPMQIGALWQEMYRGQYFEGGRSMTSAISAIDIALYDIKGKTLGVPVYQLLGGRQRESVPCFATSMAQLGPDAVRDAKILLEAGWDVIRFVPPSTDEDETVYEPRESIAHAAKWLCNIREEVGTRAVLGIDFHHRLSVAEAASFCQRMPSATLDFLEEPIRDESPGAYRVLRDMTDVPFAIGEEFASKWQFLPYIEQGLTQFARLDICNVGGFTEAMKVAGWAEAHYIDLMPHNPLGPVCTAASVHLGASVPNWSWLEVRTSPTESRGFDPDLFPVQHELRGSSFPVPDSPGLGVDVNEDLAGLQSFEFWETTHLRRRDGSHTNW